MRILLVGGAGRQRDRLEGQALLEVPDVESAVQALRGERFDCVLVGEELLPDGDLQVNCPVVRLGTSLKMPGRKRWGEIPLHVTAEEDFLSTLRVLVRCRRWRSSARKLERLRERSDRAETRDRHWRGLLESSPIGILLLDPLGVLIYSNHAAEALFARPLQGKRLPKVLPDREVRRLFAHFGRRGSISNAAIEVKIRASGQHRHLKIFATALRDVRPPVLQLAVLDVTPELEMREALHLYRDVLEATLKTIDFGVLVTDHTGRIEMANPSAARIFSKDLLQLLNRQVHEYLPNLQLDRESIQSVLFPSDNRPLDVRLQHVRVEGRLKLIFQLLDARAALQRRQEIHQIRERERWRVGQDLHDDLGQQLSAIAFLSGVLESKLGSAPPEVLGLATQIREQARNAVQKTRTLARSLYPGELQRGGLRPALQDLVTSVEQTYGVTCRVICPALELPQAQAVHLFRIAQEAVTNAVRHGQPRSLRVEVKVQGEKIQLEVLDDGTGLTPNRDPRHGLGLRSMRQHAELIHGTLEVDNRLEGGLRVCCQAPLRAQLVDEP